MNGLALVAVNALLAAAGAGLLALIGLVRTRRDLARMAGAAWLAGLAAAGIVGAILAPLGVPVAWVLFLVPAAAAAGWWPVLSARGSPSRTPPGPTGGTANGLAAALLAAITFAIGAVALWAYAVAPLDEYDGWALWGLKARALAALGSADPQVFASSAYVGAHLEYPLAIPVLYALPLTVAGTFDSNLIVMQSLLVGIAGIAALWSLLRDRVRPVVLWAWLAAIAATPAVTEQLGTGYADLQLALFVAAGVVCLARFAEQGDGAYLALGTLFLAAAALSKNEGALFATAAILATLAVARERRWSVLLCGACIVAVLVPWHLWAAVHDLTSSDYDLGSSLDPGYVAGRIGRARLTIEWFWHRVVLSGNWVTLPFIVAATVAVGVVARRSQAAVLAAIFATLAFAGLTWIYVISPIGVDDYLNSNGVRVIASILLGTAALGPVIVEDLLGRPAAAAASA